MVTFAWVTKPEYQKLEAPKNRSWGPEGLWTSIYVDSFFPGLFLAYLVFMWQIFSQSGQTASPSPSGLIHLNLTLGRDQKQKQQSMPN